MLANEIYNGDDRVVEFGEGNLRFGLRGLARVNSHYDKDEDDRAR